MRPCRPITLPTSSFATCNCSTCAPSRSISSTWTASGSSTSRRASSASSSANVLRLEQALDRVGRLRALREPVLDLVLVELDRRRVGLRVVAADDLDELAVARRARVGGDDAVDRILLRADPRQPELHCHVFYLFAFFFRFELDLRVALGRGLLFPVGICVPGSSGILPDPIIFIIF